MQNFGSLLLEKDLNYIWHPFTQHQTEMPPIPIVKGNQAYLISEDGTRYIDAISSWWVNLHGHAHPYIASKISEQAKVLEHVIFAGCTHPAAIQLAEQLIQILPGKMSKLFYTDNGSTAIEAALKMSIQFWHNQNIQKHKIISFKQGYHGDTFGAMAAAGKNNLNLPFWPYLFEIKCIDPPEIGNEDISINQMQHILKSGECACFIFEPLIQGVAGMRSHSRKGLDALIKLCKEYEVITIADEIMTGFGRIGPIFACDILKNKPDIICLSKGLTGGFLPLGAVACSEIIHAKFLSQDKAKALLHGHSYIANPIACAAALASLELLLQPACSAQRAFIQATHLKFKDKYGHHSKFVRCDTLGTILALEYRTQEQSSYFHNLRYKLYHYFISKKILLRPLGNVVYIMPPFCIQNNDLENIYQAIIDTLENNLWIN